MIRWIYLTLLGLLQQRCKHPDEDVTFDILEGDWHDWRIPEDQRSIRWCRVCGAYRIGESGHWNGPRADWTIP